MAPTCRSCDRTPRIWEFAPGQTILRAAADDIFPPADRRVGGGQITIQHQRSLKLGDALNRAVGSSQNGPQHRVSKGVFWSETSGSLVPGLFFQGSVAREFLAVAFLGEIAELRREQPLLRGRSVRQKSTVLDAVR